MRCSIGPFSLPRQYGAGHLHQLVVTELARRRHVGTATEIDEVVGVAVDADRLTPADLAGVLVVGGAAGDALDDLALVRLVGEQIQRIGRRHLVADERLIGLDDLGHLGLDRGEVVVAERLAAGQFEVVVEPVLDRRTDGELRSLEQLRDRLRHDMRRRVPQHMAAFVAVCGDDGDRRAVRKRAIQVPFLAVDDRGNRRLGQA
jgi:hypothetical protein